MTSLLRPKIRLLALMLCPALLISGLSAAQPLIAPYTDRVERQDVRLQSCRTTIVQDFAIPIPAPGNGVPTNVALKQALGLLCELQAQARPVPLVAPGWTALTDEEADDHLYRVLEGILAIIAGYIDDPITVADPVPSNGHYPGDAAMIAAYILQRFPDGAAELGSGWSTDTKDFAEDLFRRGEWTLPIAQNPHGLGGALGNNQLSYVNMALFAAEVFDDDAWWAQVRWQFHHMAATAARRGFLEVLSPHYSGRVVKQLMLARQTNDMALRKQITALLEVVLITNAHTYLPGGGVGAPQVRAKPDAGITDPSPIEGSGNDFIQKVHMVIYDPELDALLPQVGGAGFGNTYDKAILATDYDVPEVIRSIYLHKGENGYPFRLLGPAPWDRGSKCCSGEDTLEDPLIPFKSYYSTIQSWNPSDFMGRHGRDFTSDPLTGQTNLRMQPAFGTMLASGDAMIGGAYAYHGKAQVSWGAYIENPALALPNTGFSILYHYQPAHNLDVELIPPETWDPLVRDPTMKYERKSYVRMGHNRTQLGLYSVDYTPEPGEDPDLDYTLAHLPDFMEKCDDDWWVGQAVTHGMPSLGGPYLAYHPLGPYTYQEDLSGPNGDFTSLKLTGAVSGYIAEIAEGSDYPYRANYCEELGGRTLNTSLADPATAYVETHAYDSLDNLDLIKLEYAPETRYIGGQAQQDANVFGDQRLESPWVSWEETDQFRLTIARDLDGNGDIEGPETHTLEFGDPSVPTAARSVFVATNNLPAGPVGLTWDHGWDDFDGGMDEYIVFRNGQQIAVVDEWDSPGRGAYQDSALCASAAAANITDTAGYVIRSINLAGKSPMTTDINGNSVYIDTPVYKVDIEGDVTPPSVPGKPISSLVALPNVITWWTASTDNYLLLWYHVRRTNVFDSQDVTYALSLNPWLVEAPSEGTYTYAVRTADYCALWSDWGEESANVVVPAP